MKSLDNIVWITFGFVFGYLPAGLFFLWVALDCIPFIYYPFDLSYQRESYEFSDIVINTLLFLVWGFLHSFFAQEKFQSFCKSQIGVPAKSMRIIFYALSGINSLLLLYLWRYTGKQ